MRRFIKWIAAFVIVIVAAAGFGFWYFWLRDDAPPEASLRVRADPSTTAAGASSATRPTADGTWHVVRDDQVFVGYRVQELFAGDTLKKTAVGRTKAVDGRITITGARVTAVAIDADVSQLKSDKARRDSYLEHGALQTSQFPRATFALTSPIELGANPAIGKTVSVTAAGDLSLHGVTKPVRMALQARWNGDSIDASGQLPITFSDYAIEKPSVPILTTDDHGVMELQLTFQRT
jgi:polyisoprenoid-binding protein YceI